MDADATNEVRPAVVPSAPAGTRFPALHDPRYPVHRIAHRVEPYLSHIVERFHPRKIIIFGSQIYGEPRWDSDVDILVVRDDMPSENRGTKEILHSLWDVPADRPAFTILAKTSARIAERVAAHSPFYEEIIGKGLEVYAA
ncbi:MAG: nucleotidyltransferase domain-containing protein [Proteobacteria bacterium]|nr:nucleotidyltransferase domain-containing protein [Pseudomonadota bacterium]